MSIHPKLQEITNKIIEKSEKSRSVYLKRLAEDEQFSRLTHLSCGNLAHGVAGCSKVEQQEFLKPNSKNFGIISAYNNVFSAILHHNSCGDSLHSILFLNYQYHLQNI